MYEKEAHAAQATSCTCSCVVAELGLSTNGSSGSREVFVRVCADVLISDPEP